MYSSFESVNILTSLLVAHGLRHAVVCPGSRNAPIAHNLNEHPDITCHPVTDERSAGFFALGIAQATDEPVAVCVTSGTALLNVLPAVAEACHQQQSLVVISADRPAAWIGQLDGQTLRQPGALGPWADCCVTLPEVHDDESRWLCNRLVNEALLEAWRDHRPCVHINVPLSEPLFRFTVDVLPAQRVIRRYTPAADYACLPPQLIDGLSQARRPMLVVGQMSSHRLSRQTADFLFSHVIVLHEQLAPFGGASLFDTVLHEAETQSSLADLQPDFVLYVGGTIVSKRLKQFLRQAREAVVWRVCTTGRVEDTFQQLQGIIEGDADFVLGAVSERLATRRLHGMDYRRRWLHLLRQAALRLQTYEPPFSQMAAVRCLEQQLTGEADVHVHYANSSAIRLANLYARHHVWCNRGVNGIEGSLSTAAGFAAVTEGRVFCVIGDLSFFYDQNALWNQNLRGNLRILLLNNGCGGIFSQLPGLEQSGARDRLVAARHDTSAEGICRAHNIVYEKVDGPQPLPEAIHRLVSSSSSRPLLLEVITAPEADLRAMRDLFQPSVEPLEVGALPEDAVLGLEHPMVLVGEDK